MTAVPQARAPRQTHSLFAPDKRTAARNAAETRFRMYGLVAIVLALLALVWLLISIFSAGLPAFRQTFIDIPVTLDAAVLDKDGHANPAEMASVSTIGYGKVIARALSDLIAAKGIDAGTMTDKDIAGLISEDSAANLRNMVLADPKLLGTTVQFTALANGRIDGYFKGRVTMETAARDKNTSPEKLALADKLVAAGVMQMRF
ncbi:MAG: phosphate ABC transporter permease, partial [Rhodobacterales bacterium 17-64-5]